MFTKNEDIILAKMTELSKEFTDTGLFRPILIKEACSALGCKPLWSIRDKCTNVSRGVYILPGFTAPETTKMPVAKKTKPAPVVALAPTQQVEVTQMETQFSVFTQPVTRANISGAVPVVDPNYVPFGNYKDLETIIKSGKFFPVLITGHSGNGKSSSVMQIHAKLKKPIIRLNMTKKTDEETLIGSKTLLNGNVVIVEGPIIVAMRQGCTVLLDEIDAAETNSIMCLQSILEGRPYFFSATGEYVTPQPGFNVIMTANTKGQGSEDGRYIGTQILNEAFLERIAFTFEQEYPSPAVEKKIVLNIMASNGCVDEKFAEDLVKWADAIRRSFNDGALDSLIATRRLEHIVRGYALFGDKNKAIEKAVSRFDSLTKQAFIELFDKITTSPEVLVAPGVKAEVPF
jgi:hypothetical protein